MLIQWFPGHMTKSLRMMEEHIRLVDAVIYVLDARCAAACRNPKLDRLAGDKPRLVLLSKSDLADPEVTSQWVRALTGEKQSALAVVSTNQAISGKIVSRLDELLDSRIRAMNEKGVRKPLRAMIVGIPNCGKSTILNSVAKERRAETGDRPGVTRGKQWIRLGNGYELLDTPGTLWNKFEDQRAARHLAYCGAIPDDVLDVPALALELLAELQEKYPGAMEARYGVLPEGKPLDWLEEICKRRGYLFKRGEIDYDRGARAVLDDFRKGRTGRISWERPGGNGI